MSRRMGRWDPSRHTWHVMNGEKDVKRETAVRHDILTSVRVKPLDILNETLRHFPSSQKQLENVSTYHLKYPVVSLLQISKCHVEKDGRMGSLSPYVTCHEWREGCQARDRCSTWHFKSETTGYFKWYVGTFSSCDCDDDYRISFRRLDGEPGKSKLSSHKLSEVWTYLWFQEMYFVNIHSGE